MKNIFLIFLFILFQVQKGFSSEIDTLFTLEEIKWIKENKTNIRIAPNPSWPPTDYVDNSGIHQGIVSDYIKLFEKKLGISFNTVSFANWSELLAGLKNSKADFVGAIEKTPEREQFLNFTEPYLDIPVVIIFRKDYSGIINFNEISDMKLSGVKDYASVEYIKTNFPKTEVVESNDDFTALMQTALGNTDGTIIDLLTASYLVNKYGITNLSLGLELDFAWSIRFGSKKNLPLLNSILNKLLTTVNEEERKYIYNKWVNIENIRAENFFQRNYTRLIYFSIGLIVFLGLIGFNSYLLRTQIKKRTYELKTSNERYSYATKATFDAIWDFDLVTKELFMGEGFFILFGQKTEGVKMNIKIWQSFIHPNDKKRVLKSVREAFEKRDETWSNNYRYLKANGEYAFVQNKAILIRNDRGEPIRMVGAIQDISERMKYIKSIEEQNEQLKEIAWIQSHIVRAPIARIIGLNDLIKNYEEFHLDREELLKLLIDSVHELDEATKNIVKKAKRKYEP